MVEEKKSEELHKELKDTTFLEKDIEATKELKDIVVIHKNIIVSIKAQRARAWELLEKYMGKIESEMQLPANRFLSWRTIAEPLLDSIISSKAMDFELQKRYEQFITELIKHDQEFIIGREELVRVSGILEYTLNTVFRLEKKIVTLKKENEKCDKIKETEAEEMPTEEEQETLAEEEPKVENEEKEVEFEQEMKEPEPQEEKIKKEEFMMDVQKSNEIVMEDSEPLSENERLIRLVNSTSYLDGDERKMIIYLIKNGEIYQKDMMYDVGIPTTTLQRKITRLKSRRIITLTKDGNINKLNLSKKWMSQLG